MQKITLFGVLFLFLLSGCGALEDVFNSEDHSPSADERVKEVGGDPSPGARDIYENSNLNDLCVDLRECAAPYATLPAGFINTEGELPLDVDTCNFDLNPNSSSSFFVNRSEGPINGLDLLFSKEDLFFIAWVSVRLKINPHFLLGVLSAESAGNCSAVSGSHGEGCFQITNTFGQGQLNESYPDRVADWHWSNRSGSYYPDSIFVEEEAYFGATPASEQFRITIDPTAPLIDGIPVSSVVNFPFGVIASGLYFHWQHYLLYTNYPDLRDRAENLFQREDQKALWQAAAYNGGAFGAATALREGGLDFLDEMRAETRNYAPTVVDYCKEYQRGEASYTATYTEADLDWIIDLLADTYPADLDVDWEGVKNDVHQVFFADGTDRLNFTDDIKAVVYVISTYLPELAPEWPTAGSID